MKPNTTIREALNDPALLGSVLAGESWAAWRVLLVAAMGEPLTDDERQLFQQLTNRPHEPNNRVEELVACVGRRGGKSRAISVLAAYVSALCKHTALVPGETGIVLCIAPDQKQADIVLDYVEANFRGSALLAQLVAQRTQRSLILTNGIELEVRAADFRRLRGPTYVAVIADEVAFWLNENSANPDAEILNAVRPGLATTGGPLFVISSPYARKGELWSLWSRHYGPSGDPAILVAQGTSRQFNPTLPQAVVDRAYERDPAAAAAEYGAEFRRDIESFISRECVLACVPDGIYERERESDLRYVAFVDPSGGSSDSFTLAIAHRNADGLFLDAIRESRPPFSPEQIVLEFASLCKRYKVTRLQGDRYAGEWPREAFKRYGLTYELCPKPKSDLYRDLLPLINSRRVELLDNSRLIAQLIGLERRTARSGKDSIDHSPGGHDDVANACAGALLAAQQPKRDLRLFTDNLPGGGKVVELDPKTGRPMARPAAVVRHEDGSLHLHSDNRGTVTIRGRA